jgi:D-threo-aldose 1-dehydrogenase
MNLSLAQARPVGRTALRLPPFGYGAAHLGGRFRRHDGAEARAVLQAAWDCGVRHYDTAPFYGRGMSEHRVGDFLVDQPRDAFVLTTKVGRVFRRPEVPGGFDPAPWTWGQRFAYGFDYSYDGVMRSYEQSLFRLGLNTVDALLIHDPDRTGHGEHWQARMRDMATTGIRALEELKRAGDIKAIGMGLNRTESVAEIAPMVELDFLIVAMPYTLLDQSALPSLDRLARESVSVIIGAPFASGILATGPGPNARYRYDHAPPDIQAKAGRIQEICRRHGVPLPAAALQFPLAHPAVVSVIPGGETVEEVRANVASFGAEIPAALWSDLRAQRLIEAEAPTPAQAARA